MSQGIGSFIWNLIEKKGIAKKDLCEGLCPQGELSKIFLNSAIPNYFLMERLFDRLGVSTAKFEYILPQRAYELCRIRYEIEEGIKKRDWDVVKQQVVLYKEKGKQRTWHKQYIYYIEAIIALHEQKIQEGLEYLKKSILCTMPEGFKENAVLGADELRLIILFEQLNYEFGESSEEKKKSYEVFLEKIRNYINKNIEDEEVKVQIYPKITYSLIKLWNEKQEYEKARELCEESIELLTSNFVLDSLLQHVELLNEIYEKVEVDPKEKDKIENIYRTLRDFCETYGSKEDEPYFIKGNVIEISLDWEVIKGIRRSYQISQEKLANEVYTQESISRIETTKRKVHHKKFRELARKYSIHSDIYDSVLKTTNFEVLDLEKQLTSHFKRRDWAKAAALLKKLKQHPLEENPRNQQFFLYHTALLEYYKKKINAQQLEKRLKDALYLTKDENSDLFKGYLSNQEFLVLNNIAMAYYEMGKKEEAAHLWKKLLNHYEESEVDDVFYNNIIILILCNLSKVLEELDQLEEAEELCEKGLVLSARVGKLDSIGNFIYTKGWILDRQNEKKACQYYEQAFWFFVLLKQEQHSKIVEKRYQALFRRDRHISIYVNT